MKKHITAAAGAILLGAGAAQAQTADALLDKLVDKGILTVKEANELREQSDKGFTQAFQVKTGMPDWVNGFKFGGDFRGRYEGFFSDNPTAVDRNRFQYRVRFGAVVSMLDNMEVGIRLASIGDTAGNQISSNQTFDNNASKKGLSLDMVYAKWAPVDNADWGATFTLGKMENPLVISSAFIDQDYTPEGFAEQFVYHLNPQHDLKLNLGQFVLEERGASSMDSFMLAAQVRWDANWNPKWQTSMGAGILSIGAKDTLTAANGQLNIGEGNNRVGGLAANPPESGFNPIFADVSLTYNLEKAPLYSGAFPIRLGVDFLHNPAADSHNQAYSGKLTFGKAGKKKTWEMSYEYRVVQADSIYEELPESDFNAFTQTARTTGGVGGFVNGTNIRGHILKAGYSPFDSLTFFVTYWITENIVPNPAGSVSEASRLQVDAVWKF
ncbi:MAG: putative porin [Verrucomicrobiota bacterium]